MGNDGYGYLATYINKTSYEQDRWPRLDKATGSNITEPAKA